MKTVDHTALMTALRAATAHPQWAAQVATATHDGTSHNVTVLIDATASLPPEEQTEALWAFAGLALGALNTAKHSSQTFCLTCFTHDMSEVLNGCSTFWEIVTSTNGGPTQ